jgi:serine O-acetyltransferase
MSLVKRNKELLNIIESDLYRYTRITLSFKGFLKGIRCQGFKYMFFKRLKDFYGSKSILGIISSFMIRRYTYKYGFQIGGLIGYGFYIGHFGTVVVSRNARIGNNCNVAHNVTIGAARGKNFGAPEIGDRVWIGTGAVIVGNIKINSDVLIAPNAYVNFDVPCHSIVIGNPGKIVIKQNPTEAYINNKWV